MTDTRKSAEQSAAWAKKVYTPFDTPVCVRMSVCFFSTAIDSYNDESLNDLQLNKTEATQQEHKFHASFFLKRGEWEKHNTFQSMRSKKCQQDTIAFSLGTNKKVI